VRELGDRARRRRACRPRSRPREGDHARPLGELRGEVVEVEVVSSRISAKRTTRSRSCASSSQGETLPSWSSWVTTISSPAFSSLPIGAAEREVERRHVRAEDDLLRRAAEEVTAGRRDSSTSASVRRLVEYGR
jgi:hypothetical protein